MSPRKLLLALRCENWDTGMRASPSTIGLSPAGAGSRTSGFRMCTWPRAQKICRAGLPACDRVSAWWLRRLRGPRFPSCRTLLRRRISSVWRERCLGRLMAGWRRSFLFGSAPCSRPRADRSNVLTHCSYSFIDIWVDEEGLRPTVAWSEHKPQREKMKRILILSLILFAAGCSSTKNSDAQGTSMQGMWTVTLGILVPRADPRPTRSSSSQVLQHHQPSGHVLCATTCLLYR